MPRFRAPGKTEKGGWSIVLPNQAAMDTLAQTLEGKYEILSKIKEGGMGAIYLVRHRLLNELRVIKIMKPEVAESEEQQKRFFREAQTATRLRHPNITTFYDFVLGDDGTAYMVMEFIDGINLHDLLQSQGPAPVLLALDLSRQALSALAYLHRKGIVHRDISPDNIMVTRDDQGSPEVKLIDLGIAKMANSQSELTAADVFVGKLRYCSPEHLNGGGAARLLDARSDLYSYGVVLYEMLTGKLPFVGDSVQALVAAQLFRPPVPIADADPHGVVSEPLRQVVMRSLQKKPEARFQSAEDFARALEEASPAPVAPEAREAISRYITPAIENSPVSKFVTGAGASAQKALDSKFKAFTTKTLGMSGESPLQQRTSPTHVIASAEPPTVPGKPVLQQGTRSARPSVQPTVVLGGAADKSRRLTIPGIATVLVLLAGGWLILGRKGSAPPAAPPTKKAEIPAASSPSTAPSPAPAVPVASTTAPAVPAQPPPKPAEPEIVSPTIKEVGKTQRNAHPEPPKVEKAAPPRKNEIAQVKPVQQASISERPIVPQPPVPEPVTKYCANVLPTAYTQGVIRDRPQGFDAESFKAPRTDSARIQIRVSVAPEKLSTNQSFTVVAQLVNGGDLPVNVRSVEESVSRGNSAFASLGGVSLPAKVEAGESWTFYRFSGSLESKFTKTLRVIDSKGDQWQGGVWIEPCD
jgi:serine/threonine-protein kinase